MITETCYLMFVFHVKPTFLESDPTKFPLKHNPRKDSQAPYFEKICCTTILTVHELREILLLCHCEAHLLAARIMERHGKDQYPKTSY